MAFPTTLIAGADASVFAQPGQGRPYIDGNGNVYAMVRDSGNTRYRIYKATAPETEFIERDFGGAQNQDNSVDCAWVQVPSEKKIIFITLEHSGDSIDYSEFYTSDHATTPDEWSATHPQVIAPADHADSSTYYTCDVGERSDGEVILLYSLQTNGGMHGDPVIIDYAREATDPFSTTWDAEEVAVANKDPLEMSNAQVVIDDDDMAHFFYTDSSDDLYWRTLNASNTLGTETALVNDGSLRADADDAICRPVHWTSGTTQHITVAYVTSSNTIKTVLLSKPAAGSWSADSTHETATPSGVTVGTGNCLDLAVLGTTVYLAYEDGTDADIDYVTNDDDGGWDASATSLVSGITSAGIGGINIYERDSNNRLAIVYEDATNIVYNEVDLGAAGGAQNITGTVASAAFAGISPSITLGTINLSPTAPASAAWAGIAPSVDASLALTAPAVDAAWSAAVPSVGLSGIAVAQTSVDATFSASAPGVVLGTRDIAGTVAVGTWAGVSPGINSSLAVTAPAVDAAWSAPVPGVIIGTITISHASVVATFSGINPSILLGVRTITGSVAAAAWAGVTPSVSLGARNITGSVAAAAWAGVTPGMVLDLAMAATPVDATFSAVTPSLAAAADVTASPVDATWSVLAPAVDPGVVPMTPTPVSATFAGITPAVDVTVVNVTSPVTTATWAGITPAFDLSALINAAVASAAWSGTAPGVVLGAVDLSPGAVDAAFSGVSPAAVLGPVNMSPASVSAAFAAIAPSISGVIAISPATVAAAFDGTTPNLVIGGMTLSPDVVAGAWTVVSPTVVIGGSVIQPSAVAAAMSVPAHALQIGAQTLSPASVEAAFGVLTPGVLEEQPNIEPTTVGATFGVFVPVAQKTAQVGIPGSSAMTRTLIQRGHRVIWWIAPIVIRNLW